MAFGDFNFAGMYQPPPRRRLSLADLYTPPGEPDYPEMPDFPDTYRELPREERGRANRAAMLRLAQLISQGSSSGRLGEALAQGMLDRQDIQRQSLADYVGREKESYNDRVTAAQNSWQRAQAKAKEEDRQRDAGALADIANRIGDQDPELADVAEEMARAGDMSGLIGLQREIPARKAKRGYGIPADDPIAQALVTGRLSKKQDIDMSLEEMRILGPEKIAQKKLEEETLGPIENKQKLSLEQMLNPVYAQRAGAEAAARAKYRSEGDGANFQFREIGDQVMVLDPTTGQMRPAVGGPDTFDKIEQEATALTRQEMAMHNKRILEGEKLQPYGYEVLSPAERKLGNAANIAFKRKLDAKVAMLRSAVIPSREPAKPPAAAPQANPRVVDQPRGAPVGPAGGAGRPGGRQEPKETLGSYLQALPPAVRNSPKLNARIEEWRGQGLTDAQILAKLKASQKAG